MPRGRKKQHDDPPMAGEGGEQSRGNAGHNVKARADTIRSAYRDLLALEQERKGISDQINELKQTKIKGDLGMKIADFNLGYRLYKLEGDDRKTAFDAIHEAFAAMGIGEQSSIFTILEPKPAAPPADQGEGHTHGAGFAAGKAGHKANTNPHPIGTPSHEQWQAGWQDGQGAIAREMAPA